MGPHSVHGRLHQEPSAQQPNDHLSVHEGDGRQQQRRHGQRDSRVWGRYRAVGGRDARPNGVPPGRHQQPRDVDRGGAPRVARVARPCRSRPCCVPSRRRRTGRLRSHRSVRVLSVDRADVVWRTWARHRHRSGSPTHGHRWSWLRRCAGGQRGGPLHRSNGRTGSLGRFGFGAWQWRQRNQALVRGVRQHSSRRVRLHRRARPGRSR